MYLFLSSLVIFFFIKVRKKFLIYSLLHRSKVIYKDEKGARTFYSKKYHVSARPDKIVLYKGHVYVLEFKSRAGAVYHADIVQALVGLLAYYDNVNGIAYAVSYNSKYKFKIKKIKNETYLLKLTEKAINRAKKVKMSRKVSRPFFKGDCSACIYSENCKR